VLELIIDDGAWYPEQTYPDWDPATSFVVSGPLLHTTRNKPRPGRVFTRVAARAWVAATYGDYQEIRHPRRWAFRVRKPTLPGGRYTPPNE
jgi:hypothetical protein